MAFVEVDPHYRDFFARQGLVTPEQFLDLPSVIVSGHPDRHVTEVMVGSGSDALAGYLKREHRVPWKERLLNAWSGFGFVSKSQREGLMLRRAQEAGIGCPEWLAHGEDARGRAFLLIRQISGSVDLRRYLRTRSPSTAAQRRRFAHQLGRALARLHNAGFDHPDLYSKHILIDAGSTQIHFLDWQRSQYRRTVTCMRRWQDLAALAATLGNDVVSGQERALCLRTYLRECRVHMPGLHMNLLQASFHILRFEKRLLRQRRIRELRKTPLASGTQSLVWLDGEALCLTRQCHEALQGELPDWLLLDNLPDQPGKLADSILVNAPGMPEAVLNRRRENRPLYQLWNWLRRRSVISPELRQARILFRLQRYGIPTPRLLGFGQRQFFPGRIESFLLSTSMGNGIDLKTWLLRHGRADQVQERRRLLRRTGILLRQIHEAQCYFRTQPSFSDRSREERRDCPFLVQNHADMTPSPVLGGVASLVTRRHAAFSFPKWSWGMRFAVKDLAAILGQCDLGPAAATDSLRFVLSYLGLTHLTPAGKRLVRLVLRSVPRADYSKATASPGPSFGWRWKWLKRKALP
ncbi:MAG TPA: lipopolysaccharide kinase InaA family protein [Gemmataceae bacterium]|nr:lipopolysaccharide kinase InaA family protein [Gemmataceae bacterium]